MLRAEVELSDSVYLQLTGGELRSEFPELSKFKNPYNGICVSIFLSLH